MKKKAIIAAVLAVAVVSAASVLSTGCGDQNTESSSAASSSASSSEASSASSSEASSASSAASEQDTDGSSSQSSGSDSGESKDGGSGDPNEIGISKDEAVSNVLAQAGDKAEIISVKEGVSSDELPCWVVTVSMGDGSDPVIYYSGYLFCYAENYAETHAAESVDISYEEALENVKYQAGADAEILSYEEGTSPDGLPCWVITVMPAGGTVDGKAVTYYSGYLFCYSEK